jgi:hypothetical protein
MTEVGQIFLLTFIHGKYFVLILVNNHFGDCFTSGRPAQGARVKAFWPKSVLDWHSQLQPSQLPVP